MHIEQRNKFEHLAFSSCQSDAFDLLQQPIADYSAFLAAIEQRDVEAVLNRMDSSYSRGVRRWRTEAKFERFFEMWCDLYPQCYEILACSIDNDQATLETRNEHDGGVLLAYAALDFKDGCWRVSSERCHDGRTRIPYPPLFTSMLSKVATCHQDADDVSAFSGRSI